MKLSEIQDGLVTAIAALPEMTGVSVKTLALARDIEQSTGEVMTIAPAVRVAITTGVFEPESVGHEMYTQRTQLQIVVVAEDLRSDEAGARGAIDMLDALLPALKGYDLTAASGRARIILESIGPISVVAGKAVYDLVVTAETDLQ